MQHGDVPCTAVPYCFQVIAVLFLLPRCAVRCLLQCFVAVVWSWLREYTGARQAMPSCVIVATNHQTHSFSSPFEFSSVSPFQQPPWRQPLRCWFRASPAGLPAPSRPSLPPPWSPLPPPSRSPPPSHLPLLPHRFSRPLFLLPKEILVSPLVPVLICLVCCCSCSSVGSCCFPELTPRRELRRCCTPEHCICR